MSGLELVLVVVGAIAVTAFAQRRALQPPIVITVVALAASFIPGIPRLELDPDIILGVVLPPLLYSAALRFSFVSFWSKRVAIFSLGVGLVVVTALVVGQVGAAVLPAVTAGSAIVLGAVVAPPDAVSAVSIGRELGLRRVLLSVMTGESLVNDAAALTVFAVAVASVTGGHTLFDHPALLFLYDAVVGVAAGLVVAVAALGIRRRLGNAGLETVLGLVIPFAAYLAAEELEASGVLAVVTAGFVMGTLSVRSDYATRLQERQVWNALDVLLEAFVFAYMGLQLRFVLEDLDATGTSVWEVLGGGLVVLTVVIAVRPLWIAATFATRGLHRLRHPGAPPRPREETMTAREGAVLSWTGMRGVVTLAAAAGIPAVLDDGSPFPGREEIQAVAFLVAVGTLLLQGTTLPWLIRRLGVQDPDEAARLRDAREAASAVSAEAARKVYARFAAHPPEGLDPAVVERAAEFATRDRDPRRAGDATTATAVVALTHDVLEAQRRALIGGLRSGELDDEAAREAIDQIDLNQAALASRVRSRL